MIRVDILKLGIVCQLRKGCIHRNLNTIGDRSSRWLSLELGLQACQLQWSFWIKAMRFGFIIHIHIYRDIPKNRL